MTGDELCSITDYYRRANGNLIELLHRWTHFFNMDVNTSNLLKVFVFGIIETENLELAFTHRPQILECNKTFLQMEMEKCGERFKADMAEVDRENWCNLTLFISEYHYFSACTEDNAVKIGCFWPNPVVEHYIIHIHKLFFSNCTIKSVVWGDPSEDTLIILILVPVFLTLAMVALVVWCSKRSDILA